MTCIVGIVTNDIVTMGADTLGMCDDGFTYAHKECKIAKLGDMLIGLSGTARCQDLIESCFVLPEREPGIDPVVYLRSTFATSLRRLFEDNRIKDEEYPTLLVGYCRRLYVIGSDLYVGESTCGHDAIGWARELALGSLYTSTRLATTLGISNKERIRLALEAAALHSVYVRGPFQYFVLLPNGRSVDV